MKNCPGRSGAGGGGPGREAEPSRRSVAALKAAAAPGARKGAEPSKRSEAASKAAAAPGARKGAEASGRSEPASKAAAAPGAAKDGARTGSQAFEGAGAVTEASEVKKWRKHGETEEVMDSIQSGEEITGGGLVGAAGSVLSYDSRQPACLFSPASPVTEHVRSPQWAEQGEEEGPI